MPRPEPDHRLPQTTYSFEIEFLVAQELPGINYSSTFDARNGPDDALPWACPADETDPYETILEAVKKLLSESGQPVASCARQAQLGHMYGPLQYLGSFPSAGAIDEYWHVEPSDTAYAKRDSPQMYAWFGVRLRSPSYHSQIFVVQDMESPTDWILNVLKKGLVVHLNSTCRFNVLVRPLSEDMTVVHAKKLITLVWVLEKELLERLAPNSYGRLHPHVRTLQAHSRVAGLIWHGSGEGSPPQDPLNLAVANLHLPNLHNQELLARLQFLWRVQTFEGLAAALRETTDQATSFAIRPTGGPFGTPVFEFRYALWHPFGQLDASKHWIELASKLLQTSMWNCQVFKKNIVLLDGMTHGFAGSNVPPTVRWRRLMSTLGLESWVDSWEIIISQYKDGQRLAVRSLDKQKLLREELKADGGKGHDVNLC